MKIISWNINGIRAVCKKGFLDWLKQADADIVCLQEIKAKEEQVPVELLSLTGYHKYFNPAERPGYAGTAVLTRQKPLKVEQGIGLKSFGEQGRVQVLKFADFTLFNFYMINGGQSEQQMKDKLASYDFIKNYLAREGGPPVVLVGDFNVAHQEIDLARPKENEKNHGFTLPERQKIDALLKAGFIDSFRHFYPNKKDAYTWWTHWANARERNIGWRIDYGFVSKDLTPKLKDAFILPKVIGSDHCPIGLDIF